jgi:hypothetical protein
MHNIQSLSPAVTPPSGKCVCNERIVPADKRCWSWWFGMGDVFAATCVLRHWATQIVGPVANSQRAAKKIPTRGLDAFFLLTATGLAETLRLHHFLLQQCNMKTLYGPSPLV